MNRVEHRKVKKEQLFKTVKKEIGLLLALVLTLGIMTFLAGCGSNLSSQENLTKTDSEEAEAEEEDGEGSDQDVSEQGDSQGQTEDPASLAGSDVSDMQISEEVSSRMNYFGMELFQQLDTGENIFFSPYSITMALSMLDNGAKEQTKTEIETMLGITDLEQWNKQLQALKNSFNDEKAVLNTGNSLWLMKDMQLAENSEQDFFQPVGKYYDADAYQVDFTDSATLDMINEWVADKTEGMIDPFLKELSTDTEMCLINAVYFNGEWQNKFKSEDTYKQTFYGASKNSQVDMMHLDNAFFKYADLGQLRGVELPYGAGDIVMDIWIPGADETKSINEILTEMTAEEKTDLFAQMDAIEDTTSIKLALPKFKMESDLLELKDPLIQTGMVLAFDRGNADFTKIAENLFVDKVVHKAKIEVDEEGTKAAAATGIIMETTAMLIEDEAVLFTVDQPFFYCIRDSKSDVILFMGLMYEME